MARGRAEEKSASALRLAEHEMARQDPNAALAATSFLYGANAPYIEDMQARYSRDPASVDAEWRVFFEGLKDAPDNVTAEARGPSWRRSGLAAVGER